MAFQARKADLKKQGRAGYIPYYPDYLGWVKRPQKLGFKCNAAVVKASNYGEILGMVREADFVSLDCETTGLRFADDDIISINVGLPGNRNFIGFYFKGFFTEEQGAKLVSAVELDALVALILSKPVCFMWNRYFDQRFLMHTRDFKEEQFWTCYDGLDLMWLLDSNVKQGFSLKTVAQEFLGLPNWGQEDDFWADVTSADPRTLISYGALDAFATLELGVQLYHIHKRHYPFMLQLHIECKNALFRLEEDHQVLDGEYLVGVESEVTAAIEKVKADFYGQYGVINLGSPQQKSALLLRLGWSTNVWNKPAKDGTKIMSTAEKLLQGLADRGCDAARLMIRYSKLLKLESSYIRPMREAVESGKPVRFHFKDHDVNTLRFSAGAYRINRKPYDYWLPVSLQCLPKPHKVNRELNFDPKTFDIEWVEGRGQYYVETGAPALNVRKAVCAVPGGKIIKADFAQQELVIAAVLSGETTWLDAIKAGKDLHKATGKMVFGRDIVGDERKLIKGCFSEDSWVATSGGWFRAKSLQSGLLDLNGNEQSFLGHLEERDGFRLYLSNGQILEVTSDHLLYDFSHLVPGYVPVDGVDCSKVVLGVRKQSVFGERYVHLQDYVKSRNQVRWCPVDLDEGFAYLLGLYLGDGGISDAKQGGKLSFTVVCDESNLSYVVSQLSFVLGSGYKASYKSSGVRTFHFPGYEIIRVGCAWFGKLVARLCGVAGYKHVPDELFQSPRSVAVSFLAGLIDSDGKVSSSGLQFHNSNRGLISGVADLLAMLGVRVSITGRRSFLHGAPKKMTYCLQIWDKVEGLKLYYDKRQAALSRLKFSRKPVWAVDKGDVEGWVQKKGERFWSAENGAAPYYLNPTGAYNLKGLPDSWFEDNGFDHSNYVPVSILKVEPCTLRAFVMECSTHEFIGMGQRSHNCNFGLLYEIENPEWVLANLTGWEIEKCREFMVKYKAALGRLYAWKDKVILEGRTTGSIKNLYGFERRVYGYYHTSNRYLHKLGDRTCVNQSVQGLAAIMMRVIFVKCWKMFQLPQGKYYGLGVRVFAPIHDEFDLFVPDASVLPELLSDFKELMEGVTPANWPVRLRAELEVGDNMGETFVIERDGSTGVWLPKTEERPVAEAVAVAEDVGSAQIDEWVEETAEALEEAVGFSFG